MKVTIRSIDEETNSADNDHKLITNDPKVSAWLGHGPNSQSGFWDWIASCLGIEQWEQQCNLQRYRCSCEKMSRGFTIYHFLWFPD